MKNGVAIWHYPHRSVLENVTFFAKQGFDSVSILGQHMKDICLDDKQAEELAHIITENKLVLTVHYKLPADHSEESVANFYTTIKSFATWQNKYKCLDILSFDVPQKIRDNITPYVDYVIERVPFCKIALEDFGLTSAEEKQIEHLKSNERFGYLIDIGHLYIRICGKNFKGRVLFTNSPDECLVNERPTRDVFLNVLRSKKFPIFEMHLHNNDGVNDMHYFFDEGTLDIKMIADVLREMSFDGILTIESAPGLKFECSYPESDDRILKTYALWKKFLGE